MKSRTLLIAACLLIGACQKPAQLEEAAAPLVISSNPEQASEGFGTGSQNIVINYDQNVKCPTDKRGEVSIDNGAAVKDVKAYQNAVTVSVDGLQENTEYTLTVGEGVVLGFKENQKASAAFTLKFKTQGSGKVDPDPDPEPDPEPDPDPVDPCSVLDMFKIGWNLGNQLDAFINWECAEKFTPSETVWGNEPCTQATMDAVKAAGFTSVRIPVTWLNTIGEAPDYTIDEAWINRVAEVVGYAHKAGLVAIINTHHDEDHYLGNESRGHTWLNILDASKNPTLNNQIKDKIKGVWTNIANKFKDEGEWLVFESFNEINDGGWGWSTEFRANPRKQCDILNEWNQVFVDAVRATGGNNATRWIAVPTYCANPDFTQYMTMPTDPAGKTILAVHFYNPSEYTLNCDYKHWGHTGKAGLKPSWGDETHVKDTFYKLQKNYINKGIPVYLGEFGCSMRDKNKTEEWAFYKYYLEYVVKAAKTYGLPCMIWDNGTKGNGTEQHGYIDHGTGEYIGNSKEIVDLIVNTMSNESEDYTLESVYNNAPVF